MRRAGFLGVMGACVGLVAAVACSSANSGPGGGDDMGSSGGSADAAPALPPDIDAYVTALAERCLDQTVIEGDVDSSTRASLEAARAAYAAGETDIALTPSGCTRLLVTRANGKVVSDTFVGPPFGVDPVDVKYRARVSVYSYATPGTETYAADHDLDGIFERSIVTEYEKRSVEELKDKGGRLLARTTAVAAPGGKTLTVTEEEDVDGTLRTVRTFVMSTMQKSCNAPTAKPDPTLPTAPDDVIETRPCTPSESAHVVDAMGDALVESTRCLSAAGRESWTDIVLHTYVHSEIKFECTDKSSGFIAANDLGYRAMFPGKARLVIASQAFAPARIDQLKSNIAHELSHFAHGHEPDLDSNATYAQELLADPVYACETLCFDQAATTCHLAACTGTKLGSFKADCRSTIGDGVRARVEQARGMPLAECKTGHQIGAMCHGLNNGTQVMFCTTAAECDVACDAPCVSKSVSCDPSCR